MSISTISASEFTELLTSGQEVHVLDIRSKPEFENMRLKYPVTHIAMDDLTPNIEPKTDQTLYLLCAAGTRANKVVDYLTGCGHSNLSVVSGGISGCVKAGIPIIEQEISADPHDIKDAVNSSRRKFHLYINPTLG